MCFPRRLEQLRQIKIAAKIYIEIRFIKSIQAERNLGVFIRQNYRDKLKRDKRLILIYNLEI